MSITNVIRNLSQGVAIFSTFTQNDSMRVLINKPIASLQTDSAFYHGFVGEKVKTCFLFSNIAARIKNTVWQATWC
jgi:hypothetical protein